MRVMVVVLVALLGAPLLRAQQQPAPDPPTPPPPPPPPVVTSAVIPVVGSVVGANQVRWRTDVELHNAEPGEVTVAMEMAIDPDRVMLLTMPPGQRLRFADVIGEAFGAEGVMSPIIVRTSGRRSVSIRATAHGARGTESFQPQPITVQYTPSYYPVRLLQNLSFSDEMRTNIGLANLSDDDAEFTLALQRIPGRNLAVRRLRLPPLALWHFSVQSAFPLITKGDHFSVVVETSNAATYVYGSVIENATNLARFIDPVLGTAPPPNRR